MEDDCKDDDWECKDRQASHNMQECHAEDWKCIET
jgi:hypothetical protein